MESDVEEIFANKDSHAAQSMWFLAHCYEDQGKIDDALEICEELMELLRNFGGDDLAMQHKLWEYVGEKKEELQSLKQRQGTYAAVDKETVSPMGYRFSVPPKKVVKDLTY